MNYIVRLLMLFIILQSSNSNAYSNEYKNHSTSDLKELLNWVNIESLEAAMNDFENSPSYNKNVANAAFVELKSLFNEDLKNFNSDDNLSINKARKILELQRTILMQNPALNDAKIIASRFQLGERDRKAMAPSLGTQNSNWSNLQSTKYFGYKADIIELTKLDKTTEVRSIYKPSKEVLISDLRLHWDGERIMFTSVTDDKRLNVYEVERDGSGFNQLINTEEDDLEFYDAAYLPNGKILAISNIGYQAVPCVNGEDPVGNTILYNPKNKNIRRLTFDQDANWNPAVMNNGQIMYTRWEYTDLMHYYSRIVMTMNPDGTEQKALYGSGTLFPNSTFDLQPLPGGTATFAGIISGHHGVPRSGRFILFNPEKSSKGAAGMIQEIPFSKRPIETVEKDAMVDGVWPQFVKPMPVTDKYFLVAAKLSPESLWGIYLVDIFDNVTCLYQTEGYGYISPILVQKKTIPPIIPERVNLADTEATVFIQDIYNGVGLRGVPRGTVKKLRIHTYEYAYHKSTSNHEAMGIQSGWDIKRNLGTVDVEEDGSAIFKIPANTPISIQPLDEDGRAIQWMRSWLTGMPGEIVSCIGCHEDRSTNAIPKRVIASQIEPHKLTPPEGGIRPFTFELEIQPILDRACVSCHNSNSEIDLRGGRKTYRGFEEGKVWLYRHGVPEFDLSYLALHPYVRRQGSEADMAVLQPYEYHANTSELIRMLENGHHGVTLTKKEWNSLTNWIDYNVPEKGIFANIKPYKGKDQYTRRIELRDEYAVGKSARWKEELEGYAEYLKTKKDNTPIVEVNNAEQGLKPKSYNWGFKKELAEKLQSQLGETTKIIEVAPGINIILKKIPSGKFLMGDNNQKIGKTSIEKIKKSFWMAEVETTNAQYTALMPEHDSRYVDQLWKDHVHHGYPANLPNQPVIRVSFSDALEYCKKLSEKTGLNVKLPNEAQWEWACRAGSIESFWYGTEQTNFGKYDNLADISLEKMAVIGVDPQPMKKTDLHFKWYAFHPKDTTVNDKAMIQVDSKNYIPNPFGLYGMHGNIAELTSSVLENGKMIVRGGSYIERPKYATAYAKKTYYPWQRVFNVGFRIIIEEE